MRFAKIVCTLGPSSSDCDTITKLIEAGMDVARLNFSHGTHDSHAILIQNIRECWIAPWQFCRTFKDQNCE